MRLALLLVCAECLLLPASPAFAQSLDHDFDPLPVSISGPITGQSRTITSLDLLSIRQVHGLSISPDGTKVAFVVGQANYDSNSYRSGFFIADTNSSEAPKSLGSAGAPHWDEINQWIAESPQWSDDSRTLMYRMRMDTTGFWQVWQWEGKSDRLEQLTHVPGDVVSYRWDETAKKVILKVKRPIDLTAQRETEVHGIHYDGRFRPWQGMPVILKAIAEQSRITETWIHELGTGLDRKATTQEERSADLSVSELQRLFDSHRPTSTQACEVEGPKLSPDKHTAAFVCFTEDAGGTGVFAWNLFLTDLQTGTVRPVTSHAYLVSDYWWSSEGRYIYYIEARGDGKADTIFSVDARTTDTKPAFTGADFLRDFSVDRDGRYIACTRETNLAPAQIAIVDTSRSELRTLVDLNPEFASLFLSSPERIAGVNSHGEEWFAQVIKPLGYTPGTRYPLIVTTYRSGDYFLLGASGNENPIQVYAANGFAVLSFDIGRLHSRRSRDFSDRLLDWKSPTESISQAIDLLAESGLIDAEKIGITGFSHGAEIAEYAISHSDRFSAAILSGPAARDPYFFYMGGSTWHETFDRWGLGGWPEGASQSNWRELAATLNARQIHTAVLMNASDSEYVAGLSLYTSLEQLRKPVDLFVYTNELHVKNQPMHRYEIYERNVDWFRFWLKDEENPAPQKASVYHRWRQLRENSIRSGTK
jgi:dipeptidyl aminopeptidase/acylaminoacyl peptidase